MDLKKTAKERADEYQQNSLQIHSSFLAKFQAEEATLTQEPDNVEKKRQLAKREGEEMKKLEKIIKKETNEFENVSGPGATNAKMVHDKILRTIANMRKVSSEHHKTKNENQVFLDKIAENKGDLEKALKKKQILTMICD